MRASILVALYLLVTLLPLGLAWAGARPPRSFADEIASGAGMLAFSIILAEFLLSGRFRAISGRIGMDVTMRLHQLFARTALALALIHPFFYATPFNPPYPWDVTRQLTLTADLGALWSGIAAWLLLPAFVVMAIRRERLDFSYETWRLLHGAGALLIAVLVLHHTLNAGRYAADPALRAVWIALAAAAVLSLAFVYGVKPFLKRARPWSVREVRPLALRTWELILEPVGHAGLRYEAGQFVWLNVGRSPWSLRENPFSLSSAPASGADLRFIIKELGDFTRTVGRIAPGTRAWIDGPHGNLVVAGRTEPGVALIAGGVGVAPLIGILRQLRAEGDPRPTVLVYGNRLEEMIVHREELEELARTHGTRVVHVVGEPAPGWSGRVGVVDAGLIREVFGAPGMEEWLYVLCGPPAMMETVEDALIDIGVPTRQILSERFSYD